LVQRLSHSKDGGCNVLAHGDPRGAGLVDTSIVAGAGSAPHTFAGNNNTAFGEVALGSNITGSENTAIGVFADVSIGNLTNATAIGYRAVVDASNKVRVGNAAVTVIEGQVGFTASSDRNLKENLRPVAGEVVLGKIRSLNLTSWNFIGHDPKRFRHYGPMAQDFFAAFGHDGIGTIGTETTITSTDMDGILMIAAQALEKRTEALRAENADLKARLESETAHLRARLEIETAHLKTRLETETADLKARLAALERRVGNSALAKAE
jgi:hypothetical protein